MEYEIQRLRDELEAIKTQEKMIMMVMPSETSSNEVSSP